MGKKLKETTEAGTYLYHCPGCDHPHVLPTQGAHRWTYNGDPLKPTFEPSVKVTWEQGEERTPKCCHHFVRDGQIMFLEDCTHSFANKTVELPDWPYDLNPV